MTRVARISYWLFPFLLCLAVFWNGLRTWFWQDDFAWLIQRHTIHSVMDLPRVLFAPMAQGTFRFLSERVFFLTFYSLFGLDALPFRIFVFLTQFANLVLLSSLTYRLTRSRLAGLLAPALWTINSNLSVPLCWTSSYNQILCAFFLLLSVHLLLRYIETGRPRYYGLMCASFVLGFGALEINIVFPVIALAYTLFFARSYARKVAPLFGISAIYFFIHRTFSPPHPSGPYARHWDGRILDTLWRYWEAALGPSRMSVIAETPVWWVPAGTVLLTAVLLGFVLFESAQRRWVALFGLLWFFIVLGPVLPLRDHISDYYLTIPTVGLAIAGAWGITRAWQATRFRLALRTCALLAATVYVASAIPVSRVAALWYYDHARAVRHLMWSIDAIRQKHPGKLILLTGVSSELFWIGIYDRPFRLLGPVEVYLAPGAEKHIQAHPELGRVEEFVLPQPVAKRALERELAVVYDVRSGPLRNVTRFFRETVVPTWNAGVPKRIDVGQPLYADQLGPAWYPADGGYRWMPRIATVRIGGPQQGEQLHINAFCPESQFTQGPLPIQIRANGRDLGTQLVKPGSTTVHLTYALPESLVGESEVELTILVGRSVRPPEDGRELALAFGTISVE
jgi:hypothetical protein